MTMEQPLTDDALRIKKGMECICGPTEVKCLDDAVAVTIRPKNLITPKHIEMYMVCIAYYADGSELEFLSMSATTNTYVYTLTKKRT